MEKEATMIEGRGLRAWRSDLLWSIGLGVAYYVAAQLSLQLALVGENITPLWPPTGIALVGTLLRGRRLWPGIAIAAFAVNLTISTTPVAASVTAIGNTLAPLAAATLLLRVGFRPQLDRLRDALALVFFAALGSMAISATIGATTLFATGVIEADEFLGAWSVWWAGDAMGVLVFAPFLFMIATIREHPILHGPRQGRVVTWRVVEGVGLIAALIGISWLVVATDLPIIFLLFPILGLAAWRFQQPGAAPAALLVSLFATWAAVEGRGVFDALSLSGRMLTLQAFNACVAFTSFFFAAVVSERSRDRRALEESAAVLEDRVRERTAELSSAHDRLAEAQELARLGSWDWDVTTGVVRWSREMYRMHGIEPDELITFDRAIELAVPEDRERIRANVARALERSGEDVPDVEYGIVRPDGDARVLIGKARVERSPDGTVLRMIGTVQDVTERRELEREHRIADTLQRALLPERLPRLVGISLAARYVPAEEGSAAGGDWYDVIELPGGSVGLVIGDVAGHGIEAASVMGQVRMAVRAFSLEGHPPHVVVGRVHQLLRSLYEGEQMVTMLYLALNPVTWEATVVNAGHPPPLLIDPSGGATYLATTTGLPVGLNWNLPYEESIALLRPGATLVLFTDGLVDRRDIAVDDGLERLRALATDPGDRDLDEVCGALLDHLLPADASDDVAILAARLDPLEDRLSLTIPADPERLGSVRRDLRRWLSGHLVPKEDAEDVILASSEACANSVEHAYGPGRGSVDVEAEVHDGEITVVVRDRGRWRPPRDGNRGRGLTFIEACMDSSAFTSGDAGTEVRMKRRIARARSA
jgi:PAS domain S-box-containing protein